MSLYKRGGIWWYEIQFAGQRIRESTKTASRTVAREAERRRRQELAEAYNGIARSQRAQMFSLVAEAWVKAKAAHLSPRSVVIERANLRHLNPTFGKKLLCDITTEAIAHYQAERLKQGAAPKTVNLEVGTLRAILRKHRLWANLQPDVKLLRAEEKVGRALSREEEVQLLRACQESRSRSLYPAVVVALNTCMRYSEIRLLCWEQADLSARTIRVGKSKTDSGSGRVIPLNDRALAVLRFWAEQFPGRQEEHYLFPAERYGAAGDKFSPCAWGTDPTKPINRWKVAWVAARKRAGIHCRFHDLRHTGCTRMLEAGVPFSVVATIMGWSPSTTVRMVKRYGHIGQEAQRQAVAVLAGAGFEAQYPQNPPQSKFRTEPARAN